MVLSKYSCAGTLLVAQRGAAGADLQANSCVGAAGDQPPGDTFLLGVHLRLGAEQLEQAAVGGLREPARLDHDRIRAHPPQIQRITGHRRRCLSGPPGILAAAGSSCHGYRQPSRQESQAPAAWSQAHHGASRRVGGNTVAPGMRWGRPLPVDDSPTPHGRPALRHDNAAAISRDQALHISGVIQRP
jgi:hypothetical protein